MTELDNLDANLQCSHYVIGHNCRGGWFLWKHNRSHGYYYQWWL